MTCEYTRTRVVFGQPIGRFQRVQDHCVDISIHLDQARWATYEAIWRIDSGMAARGAVHEAKAVASDGYYHGTNYAHMVWAGPGTDYGHPMMAHSVLAHTLVSVSWHTRASQKIDDGCAVSKGVSRLRLCERPGGQELIEAYDFQKQANDGGRSMTLPETAPHKRDRQSKGS